MIVKHFEITKSNLSKNNIYLFYGENEGLKQDIVKNIFESEYKDSIYRYDEKEILDNSENFFQKVFENSFFDNKKLIVVSRATDKLKDLIEEVLEKKILDVKVVILSGVLEKKSKLRTLFEKNKTLICVPFYPDNNQALSAIVNSFFRQKKIPLSQESINLLVERSRGDRHNLKNELNKIENFLINKKNLNINQILKITNLAENYDVTELVDSCLSKNQKKTINILNENNYSLEDTILIIRTLLIKSKRLLKIQIQIESKKNIESVISSFKPPIFWKDKEVVKQQVRKWSAKSIEDLIYRISKIELLIKKNSNNSINILSDFIISEAI